MAHNSRGNCLILELKFWVLPRSNFSRGFGDGWHCLDHDWRSMWAVWFALMCSIFEFYLCEFWAFNSYFALMNSINWDSYFVSNSKDSILSLFSFTGSCVPGAWLLDRFNVLIFCVFSFADQLGCFTDSMFCSSVWYLFQIMSVWTLTIRSLEHCFGYFHLLGTL